MQGLMTIDTCSVRQKISGVKEMQRVAKQDSSGGRSIQICYLKVLHVRILD